MITEQCSHTAQDANERAQNNERQTGSKTSTGKRAAKHDNTSTAQKDFKSTHRDFGANVALGLILSQFNDEALAQALRCLARHCRAHARGRGQFSMLQHNAARQTTKRCAYNDAWKGVAFSAAAAEDVLFLCTVAAIRAEHDEDLCFVFLNEKSVNTTSAACRAEC
jgi:hypothetical protein